MTISYNDIPTALRVPFVTAEFDASRASQGPALLSYRALLIGQRIASGDAVADTIVRVTSAEQAALRCGRGSLLHRMAIAWYASNTSTELWLGVLDDDLAAVAAEFEITVDDEDPSVTGASEDGTLALYVGGVRVSVAVATGDTVSDVATAIAAAINADGDLPITATALAGVVTCVFKNSGEAGNDLDLRFNYRDGDETPSGIVVTISASVPGATNPSLTNLIAAMGDTWYHIIGHPYTDSASLDDIETELSSRNGPLRMIDGLAITSAAGTLASLTTLGNSRNSQHSCIVAQAGDAPVTPPYEFASEAAAIAAKYGAIDPARPMQTLAFANALPPADESSWYTLEERNMLLFDGVATTKVAAGSVMQMERLITTYQTAASGAPDVAYLDATTMLTLMYLRYSFRVRMQAKYPRHKLANDGTRYGDGQAVITPAIGKAEAVGWFRSMELLGLVEGVDQFKADLVVERNLADVNRLDFLLPPDLINQLIVTAAQFQFRL